MLHKKRDMCVKSTEILLLVYAVVVHVFELCQLVLRRKKTDLHWTTSKDSLGDCARACARLCEGAEREKRVFV